MHAVHIPHTYMYRERKTEKERGTEREGKRGWEGGNGKDRIETNFKEGNH